MAKEVCIEREAVELNDKEYWEWHKAGQRTRMIFTVAVWSGLLYLCVVIGALVLGFRAGIFIGGAIWSLRMAYGIRYFMMSVPEVTGLLTINLLKNGELRPYGSGIHFRYPWEQIKEGNYINIRLITKSHKEDYPSADGPKMHVEWSYQYRPKLRLLAKYIAVDESTIEKGITDVGSSFLSSVIAKEAAIKCKEEQSLIEEELRKKFEMAGDRRKREGEEKQSLEELYGIDLIKISLSDLDYDPDFQKVRSSEQIAQRIKEIAARLKENKQISDKDALNAAMIINKDITKHIQEVEGEGGQALAALLMAMATGGKVPEKGGKK